jgi:hypothetical protein
MPAVRAFWETFIMSSSGGDIADWLVGEGRLLGDGIAIAEGFAERLIAAGVPLLRLRIAQRLAIPLLAAGVCKRRTRNWCTRLSLYPRMNFTPLMRMIFFSDDEKKIEFSRFDPSSKVN